MPRVFYPAFCRIIIRGIERRKIFRDNKDRDNLVERVEHLIPATNTACYAWAFLSNHAHFLFRSGDAGLSTLKESGISYITPVKKKVDSDKT